MVVEKFSISWTTSALFAPCLGALLVIHRATRLNYSLGFEQRVWGMASGGRDQQETAHRRFETIWWARQMSFRSINFKNLAVTLIQTTSPQPSIWCQVSILNAAGRNQLGDEIEISGDDHMTGPALVFFVPQSPAVNLLPCWLQLHHNILQWYAVAYVINPNPGYQN